MRQRVRLGSAIDQVNAGAATLRCCCRSGAFIAVAPAVAHPNLPDISDGSTIDQSYTRIYSCGQRSSANLVKSAASLDAHSGHSSGDEGMRFYIEDARFFQHGGVDYRA
jgi:hypothetical protein